MREVGILSPIGRVLLTGAILLSLVTGCQGLPQSDRNSAALPSGAASGRKASATTTGPNARGGLAALQPCELLNDAAATRLRFTHPIEVKLGRARTCKFRREGATLRESFTVAIAIWDTDGLSRLNAKNIRRMPDIGSHQAASFIEIAGNCAFTLVVSETSRVDTSAIGGDERTACQLAKQLADAIEPNLP